MKDRYDALIFDWDGTLFDSIGWIVACLQHAARESGFAVPTDAAARSVIGLSLPKPCKPCIRVPPRTWRSGSPNTTARYTTRKPAAKLGLFEGVESLLRDFRQRGYRLAVATGKARAGLDRALRETGMIDFFMPPAAPMKPLPSRTHNGSPVAGRTRRAPERALLIGDSLHDLRMAQNAGIDVVAVACGANSRDELMELGPLYCLETTTELAQLFAMETA
jgi:phosphoglycolate phosphatase